MRVTRLMLAMFALVLTAAAALAIDLAPTIQITSNPASNANSTATIIVTAIDTTDNAGINRIDFYVDGSLSYQKDCGQATTCVLTRTITKTQPITEQYYATAVDIGNNAATSATITITYRGPNEPPAIQTIPNATILEDSWMNYNITDLWRYVSDTWTADENLTYSISAQTNTSVANCLIDSNRYINCTTVTGNASGQTGITVSVTDGQLTSTKSFTVTVLPVNDAPELLQAIPDQSVNEDQSNLTINITQYFTDIDGPSLTYTLITNTTMLQVGLASGLLNITALNNYYGTYPLTIVVSDGELQTNTTINIVINPINDAPQFMLALANQTAIQDLLFTYQINHTDVEGDTVTYTDDSPFFTINLTTGLISFVPTTSGNYTITITLTDSGTPNLQTSQIFNLEIIYIPKPGFANSTPNATYTEATFYEIYVDIINASPIDTVLFEYSGINRTATRVQDSTYKINITDLPAGSYYHRWHANYTNSLGNSSELYNFTIFPAQLILNLTGPANITYGDTGMVECGRNTNQVTPVMSRLVMVPWWLVFLNAPFQDNLTLLPAAQYNYSCWSAATQNYTAYTAPILNVDLMRKTPTANFYAPTTIEYGNPTNANCTSNEIQAPAALTRDSGALPNSTDTMILPIGAYNYSCFIAQTQNFTSINPSKITTITKQTTAITLNVPASQAYGSTTNANCTINHNQAAMQIQRNGMTVSNPDITQLAAGYYNYTCTVPESQNYTSAAGTGAFSITKQIPLITLLLNGTDASMTIYPNNTVLINATLNIPDQFSLYLDGLQINAGISPLANTTFFNTTGTHNVTAQYTETENYTSASKTNYIIVSTIPQNYATKTNITPATGTSLNQSSLTMALNTDRNTNCRWSTTDLNYTQMANDFATTGTTYHSGTITGLGLGNNNIHIGCINDTSTTNSDLVYNVQNIIEQNSRVINGARATNSILYSTTADGNSILTNVNATGSLINRSTLTNCIIINSTIKDYTGSNCYIINSVIDPSNVTGSTINSSTAMNSNATYSYIDRSTITNSSINSSTIIRSTILNIAAQNSTIQDSTVTNTILNNAMIINNVISSGTIQMFNGSIYDATAQGPQNLSDLINQPPVAVSVPRATTITTGNAITFDAGTSYDPNSNSTVLNDTIVSYYWNFGDSTNSTSATTTHTYASAGTYVVTLTVTDKYGSTGTTAEIITVNAPYVPPSGGSSGGGSGGGGGGYNAIAQTYNYDLESGRYFQRAMTLSDTLNILYVGKTYVFKVTEISRQDQYATIMLDGKTYKFMNKEIKKIDLDSNNYYDMEASFVNNFVTRAEFRLKPIHEEVPLSERPVPAATTTAAAIIQKPSVSMAEKLQEAQKQLEQEKETEKEEPEPEETTEEKEDGTQLLSAALGIAKTLFSAMKGAVTGAVTAGEGMDEKGGATGTTITIIVVILGLFGYWAYNRFPD